MLWVLCRVIKEITVLCPRQGWTFPDSQPYTLKWNSLVPTLDSSSLIALCVRLISSLTALIYDTLSAAYFFEILKGPVMHWSKASHLPKCDDERDCITCLCPLTSPLFLARRTSMTELKARSYPSCPAPRFPVRVPPRWSMCQGPEMEPESGRWVRWTLVRWCHLQWALMTGPSCFSVQWGTLCSTCLKAFQLAQVQAENRAATHRAFITPRWWSQQRSNGADSTSPAERGSLLPVWLKKKQKNRLC